MTRFHNGPYRRGCQIAMQMTSWAGRTGTVLGVETIEERTDRGALPRPRRAGGTDADAYPIAHPCMLIVQFDGSNPEIEGPIEIDGADCVGLVYGYPIEHRDCSAPYARLPPEVIEEMIEISRNDRPLASPQEYDCGCVAIQRVTARDSRLHQAPFEMALAIRCSDFGFDQTAVQRHLGAPLRSFVTDRRTKYVR